jgi:phosphoribosyl 1,2-cyclic phosphate phosphodiesterase
LVDAPPELRLQLTREDIRTVDFMVLTHGHADHIMGLDDVRRFNEITGKPLTIYAQPRTQDLLREAFGYAFRPPDQEGGGLPSYNLKDAPEMVGEIELFPVMHGVVEVLAVKVGGFAYLTDVSQIPAEAKPRLMGLDTLILDATRYAPHPSHLHFDAAIALAQELGPKRTYLTHLSHDYDYEQTNAALPAGIELSYDGLRIPLD